VAHHRRGLRRLLDDEALAGAIERDWRSAGLDARQQALLAHAERLTRDPGGVTRQDIEALRAAGLGDADVLALTEVVGYYAYVNRIASGLGVELEDEG
jgi:uncharacterized peroxidase-related enzyme